MCESKDSGVWDLVTSSGKAADCNLRDTPRLTLPYIQS